MQSYEDLFFQIQKLTQQLDAVLQENVQLKEALAVKGQLEEALLVNEKLKAEIEALKEKLNTNSSNSSVPPFQDPNRKTKKKKPTGKKRGGQPGHRRNNLGERDLRHGVLWRKISFGNQSESGKIFVQRMLTVVMTMKKQAQNALDYIVKCFQAHKTGREIPIPLLL